MRYNASFEAEAISCTTQQLAIKLELCPAQ